VYLAKHLASGDAVAIKVIELADFGVEWRRAERELIHHHKCSSQGHPHVIKLREVFAVPGKSTLNIVLEYAPGMHYRPGRSLCCLSQYISWYIS
jgi:serine/threonine protein kinase